MTDLFALTSIVLNSLFAVCYLDDSDLHEQHLYHQSSTHHTKAVSLWLVHDLKHSPHYLCYTLLTYLYYWTQQTVLHTVGDPLYLCASDGWCVHWLQPGKWASRWDWFLKKCVRLKSAQWSVIYRCIWIWWKSSFFFVTYFKKWNFHIFLIHTM